MLNFIVISEKELLVDSHLVLEKTLLGIRTALHLVLFDTLLLVWIVTQNDYSSRDQHSLVKTNLHPSPSCQIVYLF